MNIDKIGNIGPKKDLVTQKFKKENRFEELFTRKKNKSQYFCTKYRLNITENSRVYMYFQEYRPKIDHLAKNVHI